MNNKFNDLIDEMNLEQAKTILKNVLRKVPDSSQDIVLEIINDTMKKKDINFYLMSEDEIIIKMKFFLDKFNLIRDEELYLRCSWEEDYENYWTGDGIWHYYDEDCVGIIINDAYEFAVNLVNMKRYEDANKVFDLIFYTKYWAIDEDCGDSIDLSLKDMKDNDLIDIDVNELYLYIIYSNYIANKKEDRAKVIYEYLKRREFESVNISDAFKLGLEVIDNENDFWNDLLIILSKIEGNREYNLIIQAIEAMDESFVYLYKLPEIIYKTHPKLFLDYLKDLEECGEVLEIVDNGDEILEKIDDNLIVRSDIALVIARANMVMGNDYDKYFLECFKSDSNCINLIRIILEDGFIDKYRDDIIKIIDNNCSNISDNYSLPTELRKNIINKNDYRLLNFFLGNFEDAIDCLRNNKTYLGWSNDFISTCVDLFLLYLYDGNSPTESINRVTSNLFSTINYRDKKLELFDDDIFDGVVLCPYFEIFRRWKQNFMLEDKVREELMILLKKIIDERVEAIVGNGYRHSYYKVALLIVAYADIIKVNDVEESNNFIEYYQTKHSRKAAFRKELKDLM